MASYALNIMLLH